MVRMSPAAATLVLLAVGAVAGEAAKPPRPPLLAHPHPRSLAPTAAIQASVSVDLSFAAPAPPGGLVGAFLEEFQHAGDGGLYAELVQDRSFGGTAFAAGLIGERPVGLSTGAPTILGPLPTDAALAAHAAAAAGAAARRWPEAASAAVRDEHGERGDDGSRPFPPTAPLPRAWAPSTATLGAVASDPSLPVDAGGAGPRPLALRLVPAPYIPLEEGPDPPRPSPPLPWPPPPAVSNPGFWGIHVSGPGASFALVSHVRVEGGGGSEDVQGVPRTVEFALRPVRGGVSGGSADPATWLPDWAAPPLAVTLAPVRPGGRGYTAVNATLAAHGPGAAAMPPGGVAAALTIRLLPPPPGPPGPRPPPPPPPPGPGPLPAAHPALWLGPTSLFPAANGPLGSASPFNAALLEPLRALAPAFLRVPGGCYVEGDVQAHAFSWRTALGPPLARPGHWNGVWGYWSSDGLGLFEYLSLAEAVGASPLWVVSTGVAHADGLAPGGVDALVSDTLAALDFALGDAASSAGGAARAAAGRPDPFPLRALGLGNEGCGKPGYASAAAALATAVRAAHPGVALLVNCDPASADGVEGGGRRGGQAPTEWWAGPPPDGWDWHWYSSADALFAAGRSRLSPGAGGAPPLPPPRPAPAWATEFAAFDWGIATSPGGSARGAAAEAALLTALETAAGGGRAAGAAYAPLIAAARSPGLCPTALLVWDAASGTVLKTPSYHVQALFAGPTGGYAPRVGVWDVRPLNASAAPGPPRGVAASVACPDPGCAAGTLSLRLVNYAPGETTVAVAFRLPGGPAQPALGGAGELRATVVAPPRAGGGGGWPPGGGAADDGGGSASNTFADPDSIVPVRASVPVRPGASGFEATLPPWGVAVVEVVLEGGRAKPATA